MGDDEAEEILKLKITPSKILGEVQAQSARSARQSYSDDRD
jgi:hypothetical protein